MRRNRRTGQPIVPTYKITGDSSLASTHLPAAREYLMRANRVFGQHTSFSTTTTLQDGTSIKAVKAGRQFLLFVDAPPVIPPVNVPGGPSWKFLKVPKISLFGRYDENTTFVNGSTPELGYQRVTLIEPDFDQGFIPGSLGDPNFGSSRSLIPYTQSTRNVMNISATSYTTSGSFGTLPDAAGINTLQVGQFDQRIDSPATEDQASTTHIVSFSFSPGRGIPSAYPIRINTSIQGQTAEQDVQDLVIRDNLQGCGSEVFITAGVLTPASGNNILYRDGQVYTTISGISLAETAIDTSEHIYELCLHRSLGFRILGYTRIYDIIVPSEPPVNGEPVTKNYEFVFGYAESAVIRGCVLSPLIVRYREYVGDTANGLNSGWLQLDPKLIGVPSRRLNKTYPLHNHLFPISFSQSGFKGISTFCDYGWSRFDKDGTGDNGETTDPWDDLKTQRGLESFSTLRINLSNFNPDEPEYEFSIETEVETLSKEVTKYRDAVGVIQEIPPIMATYKIASDFLQGTEIETYIKKKVTRTQEIDGNANIPTTFDERRNETYRKPGYSVPLTFPEPPVIRWEVWNPDNSTTTVEVGYGSLPSGKIKSFLSRTFYSDSSVDFGIFDNRLVSLKESVEVEWILSHPPVTEDSLTFDIDTHPTDRWETPPLPILLEDDLLTTVEETSLFKYRSINDAETRVLVDYGYLYSFDVVPAHTQYSSFADPTGQQIPEGGTSGIGWQSEFFGLGSTTAEIAALEVTILTALGADLNEGRPRRELVLSSTTSTLRTEGNLVAVDLRTRHTLFTLSMYDEDYKSVAPIFSSNASTTAPIFENKEETDLAQVLSYTYIPGKVFAKSVASTEGIDNYEGDPVADIDKRESTLDLHTGLWGDPGRINPATNSIKDRYRYTYFRESSIYTVGDMYNSPTYHFKPDECTFFNRERSLAHSVIGMTPSRYITNSPHLAAVPLYDLQATQDVEDPQTEEITLGAMNPYIDSQGIEAIDPAFTAGTEESRLEVKDISTYHGILNGVVPALTTTP